MKRHLYLALSLVTALTCAVLLYGAYHAVRQEIIDKLNAQQMTLGRQAAQGIQDFFNLHKKTLEVLVRNSHIRRLDLEGEGILGDLFAESMGELLAVTRMDAQGRVIFSTPDPSVIGRNLSGQAHVQSILSVHRPVISDVFTSVQGFRAVALHVPVFQDKEFKGTLSMLIAFDLLSRRYLEGIRMAQSGYAVVYSQGGVLLYSPVPGLTGRNYLEVTEGFVGMRDMVERMLRGESGVASFTYNRVRDQQAEPMLKHAIFLPLKLENTLWSICVATPEQEILSDLQRFRNYLLPLGGVILLITAFSLFLILRHILLEREVQKRKEAEEVLQEERNLLEDRVKSRTLSLEVLNQDLVHEVAERKQAEKASEEANRAKSQFLANMSHEIRTPLNAILGFTQLLLRDSHMRPDHRRSLETVYRSGEHLLSLLNTILEMSKIEAGRISLDVENFDLHGLLADLEAMFLVLTSKKDLSLEVSLDSDLPRWVRGDEQKLRQVLNNLLGNAVKFTDNGGVLLRVGLQPEGGDSPRRIRFEVEDTGPGIPENARQTIFQHFEQLAPGNRMKGGTGLGLAIAKAYVEIMGGSIEVECPPSGGSVFRFALAMAPGASQGPRHDRKLFRLKPGQGDQRILVVDDNETNREILVRLLEQAAFTVSEAEGGRQACALFDQWRPHLVLLDMIMPEVDGFEVLKHIRSSGAAAATPVIAVSASVLLEEKELVLASGADAFLKKPFRAEELFDLVGRHLGVALQDADTPEGEGEDAPGRAEGGQAGEPVSLDGLSPELAAELREAALRLDVERLQELLALVAREHGTLARRLAALVQDYRFEELQGLFGPR